MTMVNHHWWWRWLWWQNHGSECATGQVTVVIAPEPSGCFAWDGDDDDDDYDHGHVDDHVNPDDDFDDYKDLVQLIQLSPYRSQLVDSHCHHFHDDDDEDQDGDDGDYNDDDDDDLAQPSQLIPYNSKATHSQLEIQLDNLGLGGRPSPDDVDDDD